MYKWTVLRVFKMYMVHTSFWNTREGKQACVGLIPIALKVAKTPHNLGPNSKLGFSYEHGSLHTQAVWCLGL